MADDKKLIVAVTLDRDSMISRFTHAYVQWMCLLSEPVEVEDIDWEDDWNPWAHLHYTDRKLVLAG